MRLRSLCATCAAAARSLRKSSQLRGFRSRSSGGSAPAKPPRDALWSRCSAAPPEAVRERLAISYGKEYADEIAERSDAEIIDLRSLLPLDLDSIVKSVSKTGRCVMVHEATLTSGFGAEVVSLVQEHCFYHLEAPVVRVAGWDTPYPHAQEWDYFPGPARVGRALVEVMEA